ncbi:hypothetical protein GQX74_015305 [Glossina fuscipes]|nr:hypothetical protein GQX74_015305 [Glossina fuscipes]
MERRFFKFTLRRPLCRRIVVPITRFFFNGDFNLVGILIALPMLLVILPLLLGFMKILGLLNAPIRLRLAKGVTFSAGFSLRFWLLKTPVKSTVDGVLRSDNVELAFFKVIGVRLVMLLVPIAVSQRSSSLYMISYDSSSNIVLHISVNVTT